MAQFLIHSDNIKQWLSTHAEPITGTITGSITSILMIVNSIGMTVLSAILVTVISGLLGGFCAWVFKSICTPYLDSKLKDWKSKRKNKITHGKK